jgi:hypothetical protein
VTESRLLVRPNRAFVGRRHVQPNTVEAQFAEAVVDERVHRVCAEAASGVRGKEEDGHLGADAPVDIVKAALADQLRGAELADSKVELAFAVPLGHLFLEPLLGHLAADRPREADQIGDLPVVQGHDRLVKVVALHRAKPDALAADDRIAGGRGHEPNSTSRRVGSRSG